MSARRTGLYCLLLAIPLALVATEIRQYSVNTLAENGRWVSAKPLMQIPLMGARQYLATRNALAGDRLDLRAWHGYNEVYYHRPVRLGSLALDLDLEPHAHLSIIVGRTETGFEGLRLSRHPRFPSMTFRAARSGRFTDVSPLPAVSLEDGRHRLRIEVDEGGWAAALDGETIARRDDGLLPEGLIGFRSGFSGVHVDDVEIVDASGRPVLRESFRNTRSYGRRLASSFVAALALLLAIAWIVARRRSSDTSPVHWVTLVALLALVSGLLYLAVDRFVWSRSYIYQERNPNAPEPSPALVALESWRQTVFGELSIDSVDLPVEEVARRITRWDLSGHFAWPGPNPFNRYAAYNSVAPGRPRYVPAARLAELTGSGDALRVLFTGGSQTVGVGAEVVDDALVGRVHAMLCARRDGRRSPGASGDAEDELWILNMAMAGAWTRKLLGEYERSWVALAPDLTVINVSFNDRRFDDIEESLRRFIALDRERGIETVLVVEPMSADKDDPEVRDRQHGVREVGRTEGVPVLDLEGYMAGPEVYDSGFLWWDQVHQTSYGQEVAARWLAERLAERLEKRPDTASDGG